MPSSRFQIRRISRTPGQGPEDALSFERGVNTIVGSPNTGKSKWLKMIDYLLGDDNKPQDAFGEDLFEKYESAKMEASINGTDLAIERHWKKLGELNKVYVDDKPFTRDEYCDFLMQKLQIPIINYPQGNPYGPRTWPALSWRSLFRHIYRRQEFWSDLADKQPASEQHASIMQFLGLAQSLFSKGFGTLIEKEKKLTELRSTKEQFMKLLHEVSREIIPEQELGVALTPESIDAAVLRLRSEITTAEARRQAALDSLLDATAQSRSTLPGQTSKDIIQQLSETLDALRDEQQKLLTAARNTNNRLAEVTAQRTSISDELSRLTRALEAGTILSPLKITHCPACGREIKKENPNDRVCYLCDRPLDNPNIGETPARKRLEFEMEQLRGELEETNELIQCLEREESQLQKAAHTSTSQIREIQETLRPVRSVFASILPPEVAISDIEIGRLQERMKQLERIRAALERRTRLSDQINKIQNEVSALQLEVEAAQRAINYEHASDVLTDGMNTYLNQLREVNPKSWTQDSVSVRLDDRAVSMTVGRSRWNVKLGGTLTLYFLIAYHYALMNLTNLGRYNYPGFCVLDFPAELEDGSSVADKENFVLEPFVRLISRNSSEPLQLIAAGSSFQDLKGANRIELTKIWK